MHIHIIMPVISSTMNRSILEHCQAVASPDSKLTISNVEKGPVSIESMYDEEYAALSILDEAKKAEEDGAEGVIIYCFGNPAVEAAKELLNIPVIGIGEASQTIALPLSDNYGIITTVQNSVSRNKRKAIALGVSDKLGAVIPLNLSVVDLTSHSDNLVAKIYDIVSPVIASHNIGLLHLGCGYLIGLSHTLSEKLQVPVVDPGLASIKLIELYITLGISQSKQCYMTPPPKERI